MPERQTLRMSPRPGRQKAAAERQRQRADKAVRRAKYFGFEGSDAELQAIGEAAKHAWLSLSRDEVQAMVDQWRADLDAELAEALAEEEDDDELTDAEVEAILARGRG
jgi:hypothetical protein